MQPYPAEENAGGFFEDGSSDGCIYWTDEDGSRWCKDVLGSYGAAGTVSAVHGDTWHAVHIPMPLHGPTADGCIYWEEEEGLAWCRDVEGAYGPAGMEYQSSDKQVWFSDGDAWLALEEEAAEMLLRTAARRELRKKMDKDGRSGGGGGGGGGLRGSLTQQQQQQQVQKQRRAWENPQGKYKVSNTRGGEDDSGKEGDGKAGDDTSCQTDAAAHVSGGSGGGGGEGGGGHWRLYGAGARAVLALEARLDASFDACGRAARPSVWPEMPLRL